MAEYREKFGLMKYFWLNLTEALNELQSLTNQTVDKVEVDRCVETAVFYNGAGYASKDGKPTTDEYAKFIFPVSFIRSQAFCYLLRPVEEW